MSKETKFRTCNLCEALCGLEITVEDNIAISIKGDKQDVFSKGHICPKAVALKDLHEDPDRLKRPLRKVNGDWQEISWAEGYDYAAKSIVDIQEKYGVNGVGLYQGNPSIHNLGTTLFSPDFARTLKTTNRYSATSVDQLAHHLASEFMFGHGQLIPVPDICRTDYWLILGGNPMVSNGSLMTAPDVSGKLRDIQKRGGKVVLIDPRRTETARKANQHVFVKPGTDVWFLLAMIHYVFENDKVDLAHLESVIEKSQINEIKAAVKDFSPEVASAITGISVDVITQISEEFTNADKAVCYGRLGVSAAQFGGLCHWAINTLNIITGNFDQAGGAMFTSAAIDLSPKKVRKNKKFGRWQSKVRQLPEYGGELPASTMAEDILDTEGQQIKAMVTSCGNPVLSVPNGQQIDQAFESLEFMMSIDIYLNETTRHSDLILPAATGLETPHYSLAFHNLAVHNSAKYSEAVLEKEEGTKYDWEIFAALKVAIEKERSKRSGESYVDKPQMTLDERLGMMLQFGPRQVNLDELKKHPHGIDFGPLESNISNRISNESGKLDVFPDIYQSALKDLEYKVGDDQFLLIGRRHLRSNNSWLHNSHRMVKGDDRCTALIHPDDASNKDISDGEKIRVSSRVGEVEICAEVSDEISKGTISIPHGWGHHRKGIKMKIASAHAGVSMNDLVDEQLTDALSGVAVINGVPVTVEKIGV